MDYAARLLRRQPGLAATTVLTLALGLGSATVLFAWTDQLLLRPLPVFGTPYFTRSWTTSHS